MKPTFKVCPYCGGLELIETEIVVEGLFRPNVQEQIVQWKCVSCRSLLWGFSKPFEGEQ